MNEVDAIPRTFVVIALVTLILLLAPAVIIVLAGLNAGEYLTFPPHGLSLRWIMAFFQSETFMPAFFYSFRLAAVTTLISTILGTMTAIYLTRSGSRWTEMLRGVFILPVVLPGVVLGLALYVFYVSTNIGLSRTFVGLLIGHVLVTMPFVIATVTSALVDFDKSYEEAARSLGAGPISAFMKVTWPNISHGVSAGTLFAFITSFGQFELTLFLAIPDRQPLPLAMYASLRYAFEPTAAAAGIFSICLVIISVLLSARLMNLKKMLAR